MGRITFGTAPPEAASLHALPRPEFGVTIPIADLAELIAAAEECADSTTQMVWDKFGRMVPYPDRATDAERALTPVRRLRAAVARVRGG